MSSIPTKPTCTQNAGRATVRLAPIGSYAWLQGPVVGNATARESVRIFDQSIDRCSNLAPAFVLRRLIASPRGFPKLANTSLGIHTLSVEGRVGIPTLEMTRKEVGIAPTRVVHRSRAQVLQAADPKPVFVVEGGSHTTRLPQGCAPDRQLCNMSPRCLTGGVNIVIPALLVVAWAVALLALLRLARRRGWGEWAKQGIVVACALLLTTGGLIYHASR